MIMFAFWSVMWEVRTSPIAILFPVCRQRYSLHAVKTRPIFLDSFTSLLVPVHTYQGESVRSHHLYRFKSRNRDDNGIRYLRMASFQ